MPPAIEAATDSSPGSRAPVLSPAAAPATGTAADPAAAGAVAPLLLEVEGMKCGGCVRAVEQRLLAQPGVRQASVNLLTRTAWVGLDPTLPALDRPASGDARTDPAIALVEALAAVGFTARRRDGDDPVLERLQQRQRRSWWQQWRQLLVALLLLLLSAAGHLAEAGSLPQLPWLVDIRLHALLATAALAGPGRPILSAGWRAALAGMPGMDTLVGLGMASAYLASLAAFLWPAVGWQCFFNEPVMLLGFVLLGRFLEERARFRTGRALEELAALQPDTALLLLGEGEPRPVRVGALRPGDRLRLLPGDRVPVDGRVLAGVSAVDVSSLTGEPLPLQAAPGSELAAGSLNLEARLELEVLRPGSQSAVARIIRLVEQAQARKAPIQGLADRMAGRFTPLVLALAAATFLFWWQWGTRLWPQVLMAGPSLHLHGGHRSLGMGAETPLALALQLSIAVLVVACPCALGLATPTAIAVGTGRAARAGLLFRGGAAIETAARLSRVLFDKTGTLTLGRPLVTAIQLVADGHAGPAAPAPGQAPADPAAEARLLQLAASLEASSRHPLAFAVLQEAQRRDLAPLPLRQVSAFAGQGVAGRLASGGPCWVGRPEWVQATAGTPPLFPAQQAWIAAQEGAGASLLAVAEGPQLLGLIAVQDQPRPDAAASLRALEAMGLTLGLLSGDRRGAVERLGRQLGLEPAALAWELLPEQKLERILAAHHQGPVAMVGDGINDAPALAAADLGIAVGTGTQIALDRADLVVLGDRLEGLADALRLARRTMAKVRQNLAWAFGYNLVVLPIAAGVLLPGFGVLLSPPLAALLMALSSITVVANALLLQGRPPLGARRAA